MNSKERHERRFRRRKAAREAKRAKRIKDADNFDQVFTYEHLYESYKKCLKNVRWKASVQTYNAAAPTNVFRTFMELQQGKIHIPKGYEFDLYERGKARHIRSIHIRERVMQKCLCDFALVPVLGRKLIYDNSASTKGKGVEFARKRMQAHLEKYIRKNGNEGYILTFDFKKFFDSIQHAVILKIMKESFTDRKIIGLTMRVVRAAGDIGLGLGSQVSQALCLAVPNKLDHTMKEVERIKAFARYMDDGYIISRSKDQLKKVLQTMKDVCSELKLTLNTKKTQIKKLSGGFTFLKVKYKVLKTGKIIKRPTRQSITRTRRKLKRFRKKLDEGTMSLPAIVRSYGSARSSLKHTRSYRSVMRLDDLFETLFGFRFKEVKTCTTRCCSPG